MLSPVKKITNLPKNTHSDTSKPTKDNKSLCVKTQVLEK